METSREQTPSSSHLYRFNIGFFGLYIKILDNVITKKLSEQTKELVVLDLIVSTSSYINQLKEEELDNLAEESDWVKLTQSSISAKKLKNSLADPIEVAKYINVFLYKTDFILSIIGLFNSQVTDIGSKENTFYGDNYFYEILNINKRNIYLPVFLNILKKMNNRLEYKHVVLSADTNKELDTYFIGYFKEKYNVFIDVSATEIGETESIALIKNSHRFLLIRNSKPRNLARNLIVACLENDRNHIKESIRAISSEYSELKDALPFIFHSAIKALILSGKKESLNNFFLVFNDSGYSLSELIRSSVNLEKEIYGVDEELEEIGIENELGNLAESLSLAKLLNIAQLVNGDNIQLLDCVWDNLISVLGENYASKVLETSLRDGYLIEQNNIEVLQWYQGKLRQLSNFYSMEGKDYKDIFINELHQSWRTRRDYGSGPYNAMLSYEKVKAAFFMSEKHSTETFFQWFKQNIQINENQMERQELILDLAVRTGNEENWEKALDDFLFLDRADEALRSKGEEANGIRESYVYSRFAAVAVINRNLDMLEKFWVKTNNIREESLKNAVQLRFLVDSTWAFQQSLRKAEISLMNFFLSKINDLPEEEIVGHSGYKCDLLYGLDSFSASESKQDPVASAVISGDMNVLGKVYEEMYSLIIELDAIELKSKEYLKLSYSVTDKPNDSERRKGILTELKNSLLYKDNFKSLGPMSVLFNHKKYVRHLNKVNFIEDENKHGFAETALKGAFKFHNDEIIREIALVDIYSGEAMEESIKEIEQLEIKLLEIHVINYIVPLLTYEKSNIDAVVSSLWEWKGIKNKEVIKLKGIEFIKKALKDIPEQRHQAILATLQLDSSEPIIFDRKQYVISNPEQQAGPSGLQLRQRISGSSYHFEYDSDEDALPPKKVCLPSRKIKREISNACENFVNRLNKNYQIESHLQRVNKVSNILMQGMVVKSLIGSFLQNDYKEVAINLGFIAGGQGLAKVAEVTSTIGNKLILSDSILLGRSLRVAAPFIKRWMSTLILYDLNNQLKLLRNNATTEVKVNVAANIAYLSIEGIETSVEVAGVFGLLEGASAVTGPIGTAMSVMIFFGTDVFQAVEKVSKIDSIVHLTHSEKFIEGVRAFIGMMPERYIQRSMEEIQVNSHRAAEILEFLKQHPTIQRYVFSTVRSARRRRRDIIAYFHEEDRAVFENPSFGEFQLRPNSKIDFGGMELDIKWDRVSIFPSQDDQAFYGGSSPLKFQIALDSMIDLREIRSDIRWDRSKLNIPEGGGVFCYSQSNDEFIPAARGYWCENAIGIEDKTSYKAGNYTLIDIGGGNDIVWGQLDLPNIFMVDDGFKRLIGGKKDDLFFLKGDYIAGYLDAGNGTNTLDIGDFYTKKVLEIDLAKSELVAENTGRYLLKIFNVQTLLARKEQMDKITCACDTKHIDARGGISDDLYQDNILIPFSPSCFYQLQCVVRPSTVIDNKATRGDFIYEIPMDRGIAQVNLHNISSEAQYLFNFNYTFIDIDNISIKRILNHYQITFSFINDSTVKEKKSEYFFNVTISAHTNHRTLYKLKNDTEIKVNKESIYAIQESHKWVDEIIRDYPAIANKLKLPLFIYCFLDTSIVSISYKGNANAVMLNNHHYSSFLVGNGSNNTIYRITAPQKIEGVHRSRFKLPSVVLCSIGYDENNIMGILDLRQAIQVIEANSGEVVQTILRVSNNSLYFQLKIAKYSYLTINAYDFLKNERYRKLNVVLHGNSLMRIIRHKYEWKLAPLPMEFEVSKKVIVITSNDIEPYSELRFLNRKAHQLLYFRSGENLTDLVITNAFYEGREDREILTIILHRFYEEPSKLSTISLQFTERKISLLDKKENIKNAPELDTYRQEYKQHIANHRHKRDLGFEPSSASSSTIKLDSWINQAVSKGKETFLHAGYQFSIALQWIANLRNQRVVAEKTIDSASVSQGIQEKFFIASSRKRRGYEQVEPFINKNLLKEQSPILKHKLEGVGSNESHSQKNRSFTSNYDVNATANVYFLRYLLHYLGFHSVVEQINKAERVMACSNDSMVPNVANNFVFFQLPAAQQSASNNLQINSSQKVVN